MAADRDEAQYLYSIKTLHRAFSMLQVFMSSHTTASLSELSRELAWNKASALRMARTLEQLGFLVRRGGRFALGPTILDLSAAYLRANPVRARTVAAVVELADQTGATVQVCTLVGTVVVVVMSAEGTTPVRAAAQLGEHLPIHASAAGKAIAASLPEVEFKEMLRGLSLERFTDRTITSPKDFANDVALTRKRGFGVIRDEMHEGVFAVAVDLPTYVFGRPSALVAVLPTSMAPVRAPRPLAQELLKAREALQSPIFPTVSGT